MSRSDECVAPAIPRHAGLVPASAEPLAISLGARRTPAQGRGDDGEKARRRAIRFAGYAAVFDRIDRGGDVVRAGAFRLPAAVPLLWQHRGQPVGRIEWVEEDATGLRVIGAIDDPQLAALVAAKAIDGLSFGYRVRTARSGRVRELTDLDLVEISLVARPMQPLARVHAVEENDMSNP